ncbi:MAG: hypothetical protein ACOX45_08520 [Acutalibacteraceae bacterium]
MNLKNITTLIIVKAVMFTVLGLVSLLSHIYNINNIKAKTVGDGQHETARWARKEEIRRTYKHNPFTPELWRRQAAAGNAPTAKPLPQGIVVGCNSPVDPLAFGRKKNAATPTTALVDDSDVHALMIGAAGVGIIFHNRSPI